MDIDLIHKELEKKDWLINDLTEVDFLLIAHVKEIVEKQLRIGGVISSALVKLLIDDLLSKSGRLIEPCLKSVNSKEEILKNKDIAELFLAIETLKKHYL